MNLQIEKIEYEPHFLDMLRKVRETLKPQELLLPADYADRFVHLPDNSARKGRWLTVENEYTREILNSAADPFVNEITIMTSAQILKTTIGIILTSYFIDYDPSPILILHPTIQQAEHYSKTKLKPMLNKIDTVVEKIGSPKTRDSNNTMLYMEYPGGFVIIAGANSPVGLAMHSVRIVLSEDIDRIPASAGVEGDPVLLAEQRTESFKLYGEKHIRLSTPTVKGMSRIHKFYLNSDQRKFFVCCPYCGFKQTLYFFPKEVNNKLVGGLRWDKETDMFGKTIKHYPETVYYSCEGCEAKLYENNKLIMIMKGEWVATKPEVIKHRGYWLNRLYSSLSTWENIVNEFLDSKNDPQSYKVFYNTALGEVWEEEQVEQVDELGMLERCEDYLTEENPFLPNKVLFLTVAIDTHPDRLELAVEGWGVDEENWLVHYEKFFGDSDLDEVYGNVLHFINNARFKREDGVELIIGGYSTSGKRNFCCFIDSQGRNHQKVYEFCRAYQHLGIIAIKGRSGKLPMLLNRSLVGKNRDTFLQNIGVDGIKESLWSRLKRNPGGPRTCHFTSLFCDTAYFEQLLSERPFKSFDKYNGSIIVWKKIKQGARNEAWDLKVYNYAAMLSANINFHQLKESLEKRVAVVDSELIEQPVKKSIRVVKKSGGILKR